MRAFVLDIAGIRVALSSSQPLFMQALMQRYADFHSAFPAQYHLHIDATWPPAHSHPPGEIGLRWESRGCRFDAPGVQGRIDLDAEHASLRLTSPTPLEDAEYFLRVVYALLAFRAGGVLFHAAGIVRHESACLFFGPSGSGKTTVSALSPNAHILNDDLVLLLPHGDAWIAHATPFWNPTQVQPRPGKAQVRLLLRLVQSPDVRLEPLYGATGVAELMACLPVLPTNPAYVVTLFERARTLLESVPAYRLYFRKDATFWRVVEPLL
ncbi:MAG: hypothetical protein D6755_09200 [Anaerolineae bacterium]|nr:MAG: hypothetical protein D6755_09200 [Anaerolineae bacterium]